MNPRMMTRMRTRTGLPSPRSKHPQTAGKKPPEHIPDASDESQPNEEEFENDPDDGSSDSQSQKHHPPEEEEAVADDARARR